MRGRPIERAANSAAATNAFAMPRPRRAGCHCQPTQIQPAIQLGPQRSANQPVCRLGHRPRPDLKMSRQIGFGYEQG